MKNLIFCSICVLIFGSCQPMLVNELPRKYSPNNQKIIDIETTAHNRDIAVYHINEVIERPHLKVSILEMISQVDNSYANLILGLKEKAQIEGVDAIAIYRQGINQRSEYQVDGYGGAISFKEVVAYGIIYKENLDLTNRFPKTETIYGYNASEKTYKEIAVKTLNVNQRIVEIEGEDNLSKIVQPYSMKHLLRDVENWTSRERDNQIQRRIYNNNSGLTKSCDFVYDSLNRVREIIITVTQEKLNNRQMIEQKVELEYDKHNQLIRKIIYPNLKDNIIRYEEAFVYENNRLKEKIFDTINGDVKNPIAKFIYSDYYTLEDLEAIFPELR